MSNDEHGTVKWYNKSNWRATKMNMHDEEIADALVRANAMIERQQGEISTLRAEMRGSPDQEILEAEVNRLTDIVTSQQAHISMLKEQIDKPFEKDTGYTAPHLVTLTIFLAAVIAVASVFAVRFGWW